MVKQAMPTRDDFLLRDDIIFFNHGSFGACPREIFARYQAWQLELERQPIDFLLRRREQLMGDARSTIADYLNAPADEVVFVANATAGLSTALRSLPLTAGDEILTTDHEYGAVYRLMDFVAHKTDARIVRYRVPLPYPGDEAFVDGFLSCASSRTKVIVISHITSPTALIFPVAEICRRARDRGILTIIDGAHAPGQAPVDLAAMGADMYSGNFHKWLCAPKGSAFLHARPEHHSIVDPLVISHGCREGAGFIERHEWQGTKDIAAYLSVPDAIEYQRQHDWRRVREQCHQLAAQTQSELCEHFDLQPLSADQFAQMVTIPLPECDADAVKARLYDDFRIEAPIGKFADRCGIRVSIQAYNTADEAQLLIAALKRILA